MRKVIAIDFDGCLCSNAYPHIGKPNWRVIAEALIAQKSGAALILWTCREGDELREAVDACRRWGLRFDAVNESLPEWAAAFGTAPRKVGASEYWDDKAVNKAPDQDDLSGFVIEEVTRRFINAFDAAQPLPEEARKTRKAVLQALENLSEIWRRGE
ncbi:hypothetical protein [Acutalibacter sp. 1XD8-36]|uniref:hypothetical protein n=1 Tax=Acutalibacter sp. 1XD8-36 TaxID=2320852 RepID=UPI001FADFD4B|nr:hypothetical protein [Acutalibacter sp. 1XD8-36]